MKGRQPRVLSEPISTMIAISLLSAAIIILAIAAPVRHAEMDRRREAMQLTINTLEGRVKQLEEQAEKPKPAKKPAAKKKAVKKAASKPAKKQSVKASSGTYKITFYCPCAKCCGKTDGITASGTKATADRTVAAPKSFAFGEQIRIEGLGHYVVEDRGGAIDGKRIDVFVNSHDEALKLGVQYREVERVHD